MRLSTAAAAALAVVAAVVLALDSTPASWATAMAFVGVCVLLVHRYPKLWLAFFSVCLSLGMAELAMRMIRRDPAPVYQMGDKVVRSLHWERPKKPGLQRIVVIGDSFSWGVGIPQVKDLWPYVTEHRLGGTAEVVNLGARGFTTVNEAEMLEKVGWSFHPDLVVLDFTPNDPLPARPNFEFEIEDAFFHLPPLSPFHHAWLDRHSRLYSFLNTRWRGAQFASKYPQGHMPMYADDYPGWQACRKALQDMAAEGRRRKVRMLAVIFPIYHWRLDASYPLRPAHDKVAKVCREAGWEVLDLLDVYAKIDPVGRHWWALPDDAHPNLEAHRIAGELVAEMIRKPQR